MKSTMWATWCGLAVAGGLVVGTGGCDTVKAPYTPRVDQVQTYPRITVSGELAQFVAVSAPIVEKEVDSTMRVTVPVRLLSDAGFDSNVQYRFLFLNAQGTPARGGEMSWTFVNLPPRNQVILAGRSLDADAVDWRCEIRLAK
jgi:uncharacterized protein YcfL